MFFSKRRRSSSLIETLGLPQRAQRVNSSDEEEEEEEAEDSEPDQLQGVVVSSRNLSSAPERDKENYNQACHVSDSRSHTTPVSKPPGSSRKPPLSVRFQLPNDHTHSNINSTHPSTAAYPMPDEIHKPERSAQVEPSSKPLLFRDANRSGCFSLPISRPRVRTSSMLPDGPQQQHISIPTTSQQPSTHSHATPQPSQHSNATGSNAQSARPQKQYQQYFGASLDVNRHKSHEIHEHQQQPQDIPGVHEVDGDAQPNGFSSRAQGMSTVVMKRHTQWRKLTKLKVLGEGGSSKVRR